MNKFKYIISICFVFAATVALGQTEKGFFLIGSSTDLSFTSITEKTKIEGNFESGDKTTNLNFAPQVGYFIFDKLAVGVNFFYSFNKSKYKNLGNLGGDDDSNEYDFTSTYNTFIISPMLKYYMSNGKTKPYVLISSGYGSSWSKFEYENLNGTGEDKQNYKTFQYKLGTGLSFIITEKVSFDFGVNYIQSKTINKEDEQTFSDVEFNKNISIMAGFSVYL